MGGYMIPLAGLQAPRENPTQAFQAGAQSYLQQQETAQQTNNLAQQQQLIQQETQAKQTQNAAAQLDLNIGMSLPVIKKAEKRVLLVPEFLRLPMPGKDLTEPVRIRGAELPEHVEIQIG